MQQRYTISSKQYTYVVKQVFRNFYSMIFQEKYVNQSLRLFFCILLILSPVNVFGGISIKKITNSEGLANNSINVINRDFAGRLWIGTWDGLSVYNGRDFINFRYDNFDQNTISNNIIRNIISDKDRIWIATDYGINKLDAKTLVFKRYFTNQNARPNQENSYQIGMNKEGSLYSYVRKSGFYVYNKEADSFHPIELKLSAEIKKFVIDEKNQLLLVDENNRLYAYRKTSSRKGVIGYEQVETITDLESEVVDLFYSHSHLVLNTRHYLRVINQESGVDFKIPINQSLKISDVKVYDDKVYFSYYLGGLFSYDTKDAKLTEIKDITNTIFCIYFDKFQNITWIGTDGQGLIQMTTEESSFNTVKTKFPVRSFINFDKNTLLVGTKGGGIHGFDKSSKELHPFLNQENGLVDNSVYAMTKNARGDIFIGTEGWGINVLLKDSKKLSKLNLPAKNDIRSIYSLLFTNEDSVLWIGTSGYGLQRLSIAKKGDQYFASDMKEYKSSTGGNTISNDIIYSLLKTGNILRVGTRGGGVYSFDLRSDSFLKKDSVSQSFNKDILSIFRSGKELWVGSSTGLETFEMEDNKIQLMRSYTSKNGLFNNTIHAILGNSKNIWVSTNLGLSNINQSTGVVENFTIKNGLQNNEFSDGASYEDNDGAYFFGGVEGFSYFNPEAIKFRNYSSMTDIVEVKIYNDPINLNERIQNNLLTLSHDESFVSFTVIANDYIDNQNCEYAYRIVGFSDEWILNGTNPTIVLTNLPSGKYTLEVKSTNGDRVWSDKISKLDIRVLPPWWLSNGAVVIYILMVVGLLYLVYNIIIYRIKLKQKLLLEHIEKKNQEEIHKSRISFFTSVAHEFFTPLSLIYGPAQYLLDKNLGPEAKRYVNIIKNNANRLQKLISELMEFQKVESKFVPLKPEKFNIRSLVTGIFENYSEIKENNKIDFKYTFSNVSEFTTERNYLERIFFNLISNAFKYTPLFGYVNVDVSQIDNNLYVSIKNSGNGLTQIQIDNLFSQFKVFNQSSTPNVPNTESTGLGLFVTKNLIELLGGTITVSSELGKFVCFELSIPEMNQNEGLFQSTSDDELHISNRILNKNKTVLVVEDDKSIRELLSDILTPYYTVLKVSSPIEGFDILKDSLPDLILTDIVMAPMDGLVFVDKLRVDNLYKGIPIIAISAKISVTDHIEMLKHDISSYIDKPFHPLQVLAVVENVLRRHDKLKTYYNSGVSNYVLHEGSNLHQDEYSFLLDLVEIINRNIDKETLNADFLVEKMNMSKSTLTRKIEEVKQCTPSELIKEIRLKHSAKQLISTQQNVREIMLASGFANKSYFYREFNKMYSMTPVEYRNQHQKEIPDKPSDQE